jgi:hypothetical protein
MKLAIGRGSRENTGLHDKLDLTEAQVSQSVVPPQKFFLRFGQIDVVVADDSKGVGKGFDCFLWGLVMVDL